MELTLKGKEGDNFYGHIKRLRNLLNGKDWEKLYIHEPITM